MRISKSAIFSVMEKISQKEILDKWLWWSRGPKGSKVPSSAGSGIQCPKLERRARVQIKISPILRSYISIHRSSWNCIKDVNLVQCDVLWKACWRHSNERIMNRKQERARRIDISHQPTFLSETIRSGKRDFFPTCPHDVVREDQFLESV